MMNRFDVLARRAGPLLMLAALLWAGGCLPKAEYRPINYFDLRTGYAALGGATPKTAPAELRGRVLVRSFRMVGPYRSRLVYRRGGQRLTQDEYNRWILPPEDLVQGQFAAALGTAAPDARYTLWGAVLVCEARPTTNEAALAVELQVLKAGDAEPVLSKRYEELAPLTAATPEAVADALGGALEVILDRALADIGAMLNGRH